MKSASRMIQTQIMLAGVAYDVLAPVTYKVANNGSSGQMQTRVSK